MPEGSFQFRSTNGGLQRSAPPGTAVQVVPKVAPAKPGKTDPKKKTGEKPKAATQRSNTPPQPPDPNELKIRPNANGKIRPNFRGQPWPKVLEWVSEISGLSLDWQELPPDYLNLVTQRDYSVPEVRDMINMRLLTRGYTMLQWGEGLQVINVKKLNPAMVPRVRPEELVDRHPYEFVKVSFKMGWMLAEDAAAEFKGMISPNGKLTPLTATNRLEAMDAVINLMEIDRVLAEEQSAGTSGLLREFPMRFTRADEIIEDLRILLGIGAPSGGRSSPIANAQMAQIAKMLAAKKVGSKSTGVQRKKVEVRLLASQKHNSIIVQAPPDKMAIIAQAIQTLDRPNGAGPSIPEIMERTQIYRLTSTDANTVIKILKSSANLSASTQLEVDPSGQAIIVFGSMIDQYTIRQIIEKLDGSGRQFHVIQLRKQRADFVATTIKTMMGIETKKKSSSSGSYYDPFLGYVRNRSSSGRTSTSTFSIEADVEFNRLLIRANSSEIKDVEDLLIKLGEIQPLGGNSNRMRVIQALDVKSTDELLERLRKAWPNLAPNPLQIEPKRLGNQDDEAKSNESVNEPTPTTPKKAEPDSADVKKATAKPQRKIDSETDLSTFTDVARNSQRTPANENFQNTVFEQTIQSSKFDSTESRKTTNAKKLLDNSLDANAVDSGTYSIAPPLADRLPSESARSPVPKTVHISQSPDGRLVITSDDTRALDLMEDLIRQLSPRPRGYRIFKLKNAASWAWGIADNLKDFFEEDKDKNGNGYSYDPWMGFMRTSASSSTGSGLGRRQIPKFISDPDTNSILVQGASVDQLQIIEELINLWDVEEDETRKAIRITKTFPIKYSKAKVIAKAIKDVYRDLLSSNDRALQNPQNQNNNKEQRPAAQSYTYIYGQNGDDESGKRDPPIRFKGLISIGVDELSDTLIVSATESLLGSIGKTITELDELAKPSSAVEVVRVRSRGNTGVLLKSLNKIFGKQLPAKQPNQKKKPGQPAQPNQPELVSPSGF